MTTEVKHNYYEVLEVQPSASQHDMTLAYEKAKRTYSPQNAALYSVFTEDEAKSLRSLIEEAYSVLGNQSYRNIYDRRLQSKSYSGSDLSLESIKKASEELFSENSILEKVVPIHKITNLPDYEKNETLEGQIKMANEWSGDLLRKVREYKKYSLELLHEKTKVNPWYIAALERMEPENLPAPVFVRGYVLQMAKTLGLDEKQVADSYMKLYKQKVEQPKKK